MSPQATKKEKKKVERLLHELSNVDGKFACAGSPGLTGKGMAADLQGSGLGPTTVGHNNPAPWTAWEVGICLH